MIVFFFLQVMPKSLLIIYLGRDELGLPSGCMRFVRVGATSLESNRCWLTNLSGRGMSIPNAICTTLSGTNLVFPVLYAPISIG